ARDTPSFPSSFQKAGRDIFRIAVAAADGTEDTVDGGSDKDGAYKADYNLATKIKLAKLPSIDGEDMGDPYNQPDALQVTAPIRAILVLSPGKEGARVSVRVWPILVHWRCPKPADAGFVAWVAGPM